MSDLPKLILCIEDDMEDKDWIEEATVEVDPGIIFVAKSNGPDAIKFLLSQKEQNYLPCLILLDLNMPGMDGKETLKEIKKDPALREIPLIVFTTSNDRMDQLFCSKYNVDMVSKPDRPKEFKRVIQYLVLSRCA